MNNSIKPLLWKLAILCFTAGFLAGCRVKNPSPTYTSTLTISFHPSATPAPTNTQAVTVRPSPTNAPSLTLPPTPTSSRTPSPTPSPSPTDTATPFILPLLAKTPLLQPVEPITVGNAGRIVEWARWGNGNIREAIWSSDGKWLAISSQIGLAVYDAETLEEAWFVAGYFKMLFSPGGQELVTSDGNGDISWYDVLTGEVIRSSHIFNRIAYALALSPNGEWLAAIGYDDADQWIFVMLNASTGEQSQPIKECAYKSNIAFTPDSKVLACIDGYQVVFWDIANGRVKDNLIVSPDNIGDSIVSMAFSPNGKYLATGDGLGIITLWSVASKKKAAEFGVYSFFVDGLAFSPDGRMLAYNEMGYFNIVDMGSFQQVEPFGTYDEVYGFTFLSDGRLLALYNQDGAVKIASVTLKDVQDVKNLDWVDFRWTKDMEFSPSGSFLAVALRNTVELWSMADARLAQVLAGNTNPRLSLNAIAFSPDGNLLATGGDEGSARLWEVASGQQIRMMGELAPIYSSQTEAEISSLDFSPDGQWLAAGYYGGRVRLWDIQTGTVAYTMTLANSAGYAGKVQSLDFSPDQRYLAASNGFGTISLWSIKDGKEMYAWKEEASNSNIAFSPGGVLGWIWSHDQVNLTFMDIYRENNPRAVTFSAEGEYRDGSIAFSPDGSLLASAYEYEGINILRLWEVASGQLVGTLSGHTFYISDLAFSPDGLWLTSVSQDGTVRFWGVR